MKTDKNAKTENKLKQRSQVWHQIAKRGLTLFLMLLMLLLPHFPVISAESGDALISETVPYERTPNPEYEQSVSFRELITKRDKNVKQFYLGDGITQLVSFGKSIHRLDEDNNWNEIDNSLHLTRHSDGEDYYETKDGWASFSANANSCAEVSLNSYNYSISLTFISSESSRVTETTVVNDEAFTSQSKFSTVDEASSYYANCSSKSTVTYKNICQDTELEFILYDNDLKGNIIISSPAVLDSYSFELSLNGLVPKLITEKSIVLADAQTGDYVYEIISPCMIDAKGEISTDIIQTLEQTGENSYLLTIEADEKWVLDSERSFPVTIDPVLRETDYYDTYIDSYYPTQNYGGSSQLWISDSCVSYMKATLSSIPANSLITSAYFYVAYYYYSGVTSGSIDVGLYQVLQNWGEYSWNWNTANQYTDLGLASTPVSTRPLSGSAGAYETTPKWQFFTVTSLVNSWFNGTNNYGVALKREGGSNYSVLIKSYEGGSDYRPYFTISYKEPIIEEGVYYLKSTYSNLYLETENGGYTSGTSLVQKSKVENAFKQLFKITYIGASGNDRYYDIRPMTNSALGLYAPLASSSTHTVSANSMATTDGWYDIPQTQRWTIQTNASGNYVTLLNAFSDNGSYMSVPNSTVGSIVETTTTLGVKCRWRLEKYTGGDLCDLHMSSFSSAVGINQSFTYTAYMCDSQIGVNGPVSYRVGNNDHSTTDKATINATTGQLTALKNGAIKIGVTYTGAPWIWWFSVRITPYYGCKTYNEILDANNPYYASMNCHGYALWSTSNLNSNIWLTITNSQLSQVNSSNDLLDIVKPQFEEWMNNNIGANKWEDVTNSGGINAVLANNEWLIVLRVGYHPELLLLYQTPFDYHFWYRTDNGEWANKHGYYSTSQPLGTDIPSDSNSIGWKMDYLSAQYYDSDLLYYVITE